VDEERGGALPVFGGGMEQVQASGEQVSISFHDHKN
jgi:hypothetical protein